MLIAIVTLMLAAPVQDKGLPQVSAPAAVAHLDKLKGEPVQLAWSVDGTQLFVQTAERDNRGMIKNPRYYVLPSNGQGKPSSVDAPPQWATEYWTWKSHKSAPGLGSFEIAISDEQKTATATAAPMGGALARGGGTDPSAGTTMDDATSRAQQMQVNHVITLRLKGETVGEFVNQQFLPGYTFGWAPGGDLKAVIAYANDAGRLALMNASGKKQEVEGTKNVILPAWSQDGTKIAFLQKNGKNKYDLCVADVKL